MRIGLLAALVTASLVLGVWVAQDPSSGGVLFVELPIFGLLGLWYAGWRTENPDLARIARRLFLFALAVRIPVLLWVDAFISPNAIAPDQRFYEIWAARIAEYWQGGWTAEPPRMEGRRSAYFYVCAALYYVLGENPLGPKVLNALAGALSAAVIFRLAARFCTARAALIAGILVAVFPSMILWSVLHIRDALVVLGLVLAFDALAAFQQRPSVRPVLELALGVLLVSSLRGYMTVMLLGALAVGWVAGRDRTLGPRRLVAALVIVLVVLVGMRFAGLIDPVADEELLQKLQEQRQGLAEGGSVYGADADISTPLRALLFLPVGVAYFLLGPFPWAISSALQLAAVPEVLLWYLLVPFVAVGIARAFRQSETWMMGVLTFLIVVTTSYSLVSANLGTAYRHRAQVLVFFLLFAGIGLDVLLARRKERCEQLERQHRPRWLDQSPAITRSNTSDSATKAD